MLIASPLIAGFDLRLHDLLSYKYTTFPDFSRERKFLLWSEIAISHKIQLTSSVLH
jgi:hypothetical protein